MHRLLEEYLPKLGMQTRKWILDAAAVAAYHAQTQWPVARLLVCDGAPQFTWITEELGLCWVHEGRHYKKLFPYVAQHQKLLEDFHCYGSEVNLIITFTNSDDTEEVIPIYPRDHELKKFGLAISN